MKLLALGDVVGAYGTRETAALLPRLRRETGADFVVVNAENAAPGNGTDPASAELLLASGADVLTGGNHTLRRYDFFDMLNEHDWPYFSLSILPCTRAGDITGAMYFVNLG